MNIRFDSYTLTYVGDNVMGAPLSINDEDLNNET